ncbi:MAG: rhodanese-like domain-containing protein [Myxococcales bacterium]
MPRQITPAELSARLQRGEKPYLLDVRQAWEHQLSRIEGSVLVPLPELPARLDDVAPAAGQAVVAYCHHGMRSLSAAALLEQHGLKDVLSLAGGIEAWSTLIDPKVPRY